MNTPEIHSILLALGEHVPPGSQLTLIGGSALALLGSSRPTLDIDFIGDDLHPSELHQTLLRVAKTLKIYLEAVPFEHFVPLPPDHAERTLRIGQFGNLDVYVADPYSIALSKLDRGLDTDLDDLVFLLQHGHIHLAGLERLTHASLAQAQKYDFNPRILNHLQELKKRLP